MTKEKLQRHQSYVSQKWDENADNFRVNRWKRLVKLNRMILALTNHVIDEIWDEVEQQTEVESGPHCKHCDSRNTDFKTYQESNGYGWDFECKDCGFTDSGFEA